MHFFPPQIHPECPLSRRKEERPGKPQHLCVQESRTRSSWDPSTHQQPRAQKGFLFLPGLPGVSKGRKGDGALGMGLCALLHKSSQARHNTPCYLQFSDSTSPAPAKAAFVFFFFFLPLSFLKQITTIVQLNFTKMTSHTSEKNV